MSMLGPRQGVHLSPQHAQHLQQWKQLHRMMKWRAFQFRDPDDTYVYRARIEPHPPQLPVAAEAKQHTAFPSRGPTFKRSSSVTSVRSRPSTASNATTNGATSSTPARARSASSSNIGANSASLQSSHLGQKDVANLGAGEKALGSEFTLSATAVSIQPRQLSQRSQTKPSKQLIVNLATFPYPDPSKVKGNPGFVSRLAELARLEAVTIRSEQAKARLMSRPTSARSLKSSASSTASSKSNYQSTRRTNVNSGRFPSTMKRMNSSPAMGGGYVSRGGTQSGSSVLKKQYSLSDIQNRTRKVYNNNGNLGSVEEHASKPGPSLEREDDSKEKLGATANCTGDTAHEPEDDISSASRGTLSTADDYGDAGNGMEVHRSCSPPIIFVRVPKCTWSVGGESSTSVESLPTATTNEETHVEQSEAFRKTSDSLSVSHDTSKARVNSFSSSSSVNSSQDSASNVDNRASSCKAVVEDDLKVTSDLGLSIDSLHLSQEESAEQTVAEVAVVTKGQSSNNTGPDVDACAKSSDESVATANEFTTDAITVAPGYIVDNATEEVGGTSAEGNAVKRTRRKNGKRSAKHLNGSVTAQVVVSASSTNNKQLRNTHKTVKRSSKKK